MLAEDEFYRVDGHTPVKFDIRVITATHQNLEERVTKRVFREDLYHRLNVIKIQLPRLRDRKEDIPRLARFFLDKAARELNVDAKKLTPEAEQVISRISWPGNVRQLENTCRWLTVMAAGRKILVSNLPEELMPQHSLGSSQQLPNQSWQTTLREYADQALSSGNRNILSHIVPDIERTMIKAALHHAGRRKREAELLLD